MDDTLVPLALAIATTVFAVVALRVALFFMDDWSWRRRRKSMG